MQFNRDGLNIPDELVRRQKQGNVVFLCGAGVGSYPRASIDNMAKTTYHISVNQDDKKLEFEFLKGKKSFARSSNRDEDDKQDEAYQKARTEITVALNGKILSFLLGAGCSSLKDEKEEEKGISIMDGLASKFSGKEGNGNWKELKDKFGIERKTKNLEQLLLQLQAAKTLLQKSDAVLDCIKEVKKFIFDEVNIKSDELRKLYESFYKSIFFRDKTLSRPWVFTTNYDVFNEKALDHLAIPYCNGFSGGLERVFNPATFRLTLARQLDISSGKWDAVENFVYLCKLHGSISWFYDGEQGLYPFCEQKPNEGSLDHLMIYPSPAKQEQSLGSPYSDLFREFQGRVVQEQSVLIVIGYSFSDKHINNIIYQALTIPSFRLIIFTNPEEPKDDIKDLKDLDDPRIWLIGSGDNQKLPAHFFKSVIDTFLPEVQESDADKKIEAVMKKLGNKNAK